MKRVHLQSKSCSLLLKHARFKSHSLTFEGNHSMFLVCIFQFHCHFVGSWWMFPDQSASSMQTLGNCISLLPNKRNHKEVLMQYCIPNSPSNFQGLSVVLESWGPIYWWLPGITEWSLACMTGVLAINFTATACNHMQLVREYLFFHIDLKLPGSRQLLCRHLSQVYAPTVGWPVCLDILLEAEVTHYSSITHLVDYCIYYLFIYDPNWCNAVLCMCECHVY